MEVRYADRPPREKADAPFADRRAWRRQGNKGRAPGRPVRHCQNLERHLLRQHVNDRTSLGQTIKSYLDRGDLVPDSVVTDMLRKPVVTAAQAGGYVLDGFPRTVEQARTSFPTAHAVSTEAQVAVRLDVAPSTASTATAGRRGSEDT
jgi:adenylate kinase